MKPYTHAVNSARVHGGKPEDYIEIHNFMDISKSAHADMRHRAILHNSLGPYIAEMIFGIDYAMLDKLKEKFNWNDEEVAAITELISSSHSSKSTFIKNSSGEKVQVRTIAEEHILEDMGKIPSVSEYLNMMPFAEWLSHRKAYGNKIVMYLSDKKVEK